jgi:hypothetical protein
VNENDDADFWLQVEVRIWNPKTTKSTALQDPLRHYLHHCIAHSIAGRHDTGNVGRTDLFFLYCLVTNSRCNLAYCLADFFHKAIYARPTAFLVGGSFISTIVLHFGGEEEELHRGCTYEVYRHDGMSKDGFRHSSATISLHRPVGPPVGTTPPGVDPDLVDFEQQQQFPQPFQQVPDIAS